MCQLHQISACPHAAVLGNEGVYTPIYKLCKEPYYLRMYSRPCLQKRSNSCQHCRLYIERLQRFSCACGVTSYNIVLQSLKVILLHSPLSHRAKTGIDAVDNPVTSKILKEGIALLHPLHCLRREGETAPFKEIIFYV